MSLLDEAFRTFLQQNALQIGDAIPDLRVQTRFLFVQPHTVRDSLAVRHWFAPASARMLPAGGRKGAGNCATGSCPSP